MDGISRDWFSDAGWDLRHGIDHPHRQTRPPERAMTSNVHPQAQLVTAAQAARLLGVNRRRVLELADTEGFPPAEAEEHTSELQSLAYLVCRLLLEKKKK